MDFVILGNLRILRCACIYKRAFARIEIIRRMALAESLDRKLRLSLAPVSSAESYHRESLRNQSMRNSEAAQSLGNGARFQTEFDNKCIDIERD